MEYKNGKLVLVEVPKEAATLVKINMSEYQDLRIIGKVNARAGITEIVFENSHSILAENDKFQYYEPIIISDDEGIKVGDYYLANGKISKASDEMIPSESRKYKKILVLSYQMSKEFLKLITEKKTLEGEYVKVQTEWIPDEEKVFSNKIDTERLQYSKRVIKLDKDNKANILPLNFQSPPFPNIIIKTDGKGDEYEYKPKFIDSIVKKQEYPFNISRVKQDRPFRITSMGYIHNTRQSPVNKNHVSSEKRAKAFLALIQLVELRDAWNKIDGFEVENNIPEWRKYNICKSSCLYFGSRSTRNLFLNTFQELIKEASELLTEDSTTHCYFPKQS